MAIAVLPEGPRDRWERIGLVLLAVAAMVVVGLLVAFVVAEYVL